MKLLTTELRQTIALGLNHFKQTVTGNDFGMSLYEELIAELAKALLFASMDKKAFRLTMEAIMKQASANAPSFSDSKNSGGTHYHERLLHYMSTTLKHGLKVKIRSVISILKTTSDDCSDIKDLHDGLVCLIGLLNQYISATDLLDITALFPLTYDKAIKLNANIDPDEWKNLEFVNAQLDAAFAKKDFPPEPPKPAHTMLPCSQAVTDIVSFVQPKFASDVDIEEKGQLLAKSISDAFSSINNKWLSYRANQDDATILNLSHARCDIVITESPASNADKNHPTPKIILIGYKEIIKALGGKDCQLDERALAYAAKNSGAPITLGKRGVKPRAEKVALINWYNRVQDNYDEASGNAVLEKRVGKSGERIYDGKIAFGQVKQNFRSAGKKVTKGH